MIAIDQLGAEQTWTNADSQVGRRHLVFVAPVADVPKHAEDVA